MQRSFVATDKDKGTVRDTVRPLLTVALHPSGYYMAAGFISFVLVMHVLHNELKPYKQLKDNKGYDLKNCSKIAFSNGGHLLVVCDTKNLYLFSAFTCE